MKTVQSEMTDLDDVSEILKFWLSLGVDGFNFIDLHLLSHNEELPKKIQKWRNTLDRNADGLTAPVIMVPVKLLELLERRNSEELHHMISLINIIDMPLDMAAPLDQVIIKN